MDISKDSFVVLDKILSTRVCPLAKRLTDVIIDRRARIASLRSFQLIAVIAPVSYVYVDLGRQVQTHERMTFHLI